ncbi:glycosyltransferase family 4 protein [Clostridium sp. YIM B02551]|uniref:glycosyltransferase family 4 protein n=1 Tax=Clostridium sp. YIM B02551 TaxID=2910679 RepID=UPI001EEB60C6|nr:glycosyltransferase family 4 protein [Clostridium sp. YIM B02551]
MKILTIPSWYPTEDNKVSGVFFKEQVEALKENGIEGIILYVHFISLKQMFTTKLKVGFSFSIENGIKVYRYNTFNVFPRMYGLFFKYYSYLIRKYFKRVVEKEGSFDLVHIHSSIYGAIAYNLSNIDTPYIITEHSSAFSMNEINDTVKRYLYGAFGNAKEVIAVGKGLLKDISVYRGEGNLRLIPNMLTLKEQRIESDKNKTRFRFFSLGTLYQNKGMDILVEAFNKNKEAFSNVELYIGGDGEERGRLEELIEKYDLKDRIIMLGGLSREEVAIHMANCDVFALASRFETFGIVFLEALTFGKPVIGTKTGGPDTIINDICGKIVDVDDIDGFGEAMLNMYNNINKYDSDEIKSYCKHNFSKDVIASKIIDVYRSVIKNQG